MTRCCIILVVSTMLAGAGTAAAQRPVKGCAENSCSTSRCCGCPDDYCRKPSPRIACPPCGEPSCYCRKPAPCIGTFCGGCPDDYCRKPCPRLCPPTCQNFYVCAPVDGACCSVPRKMADVKSNSTQKVSAFLHYPR